MVKHGNETKLIEMLNYLNKFFFYNLGMKINEKLIGKENGCMMLGSNKSFIYYQTIIINQ